MESHFPSDGFSAITNNRTTVPAVSPDSGHARRFSFPFPGILAIVLSVAIWVILGVSIWQLI